MLSFHKWFSIAVLGITFFSMAGASESESDEPAISGWICIVVNREGKRFHGEDFQKNGALNAAMRWCQSESFGGCKEESCRMFN